MIEMFEDIIQKLAKISVVKQTYHGWALIPPQSKQSTSFGRGHSYQPKKKVEYVKALSEQSKSTSDGLLEGSIRAFFIFCFQAKEEICYKSTHPDLDNLEKPAMDALKGVCIANDAKIVSKSSVKIKFSLNMVLVRLESLAS